jgi:hypothetical protein
LYNLVTIINPKAKGVPLRRLLALIFIICASQILNAKPTFTEYTTKLLSVEGRFATVKDSPDIYIGSSGIVTHAFDATTQTIVARVEVVEKKDGIAKLKFNVYKDLSQQAFPLPGILPQKGDKVILNYLYNRSLIVAPNFKVFKEITKHFKDIQWVHPDLMGAYLAKEYKPNPNREDFQKMCALNATSLIFFALDYHGYFVDCHDFKIIKKFKSARIKHVQLPFFTRVPDIESSWFNWGSGTIRDYTGHYENLLRN